MGVKWWDDLVNAVLDGYFGADEAGLEEGTLEPSAADQAATWEAIDKATNHDRDPRPGLIRYRDAMAVVVNHLPAVPGGLLILDVIDADFRRKRLTQENKRALDSGVKRRVGGAGWKGPRQEPPAEPPRSEEEERAYRAAHRSRTGYRRGRPKKEEEGRSYPAKRPRGRPPKLKD